MPSSTYGQFQDALLDPATTHLHMAGRTDVADHTTEKHVLVDSSGKLQVDVVSMSGGGDATAANQATMIASLAVIEGDTTSLDSKVTACNTGAVVVSSSALPTGAATESSLASVDGKITACNTGAVVVSSSALPTGAATQTTLASVDTKITACNTGAVVVSSSALPSGAATESSLATVAGDTTSIDGKITACNTGAVVVSSSALPSGAATESSLATVAGDTTSIDGKITACNTGAVVVSSSALPSGAATEASLTAPQYQEGDTVGASDKGVLVMGRNGTNAAKPIHITANGDVEVEIADFVKGQAASSASFPVVLASDQSTLSVTQASSTNLGSHGNILSNSSLANGATTSSVDVSNISSSTILVEDTLTSSSDGYDVEISVNGTDFYNIGAVYPISDGSKRKGYLTDLKLHGVTDLRLKNNSSTDTYTAVYATVVGSPN